MVNFGERLAYWYLRLNGFFQVETFVLHGTAGGPRSADADLLGIRLRHSVASIDGTPVDCDSRLAAQLGGFDRHLAVVVQVKTGPRSDPGAAFDHGRLERCLRFIGLSDEDGCRDLLTRLTVAPRADFGDAWRVGKLLVAEHAPPASGHLTLDLDHVLSFIESRLATFHQHKSADRLFFSDELMQLLAWRAGRGGRPSGG